MLVGESVPDVLPEWAFFVRAVLDTERLGLCASREALHDDELLDETRARLGDQLKRWLLRMARTDRQRAEDFFRVHHLAVKAAARHRRRDARGGRRGAPWETTLGTMTLAEFSALDRVITYVDAVEDFQQVAAIARAEDIAVLNAGYAYDRSIVERWVQQAPERDAHRLEPRAPRRPLHRPRARRRGAVRAAARCRAHGPRTVAGVPVVRSFRPATLHAVLLVGRDIPRARPERGRRLVDGGVGRRPRHHRPAGCRAAVRPQRRAPGRAAARRGRRRAGLQRLAVEALYAHALLAGGIR